MRTKTLATATLFLTLLWFAAATDGNPTFHGHGRGVPKVDYDSLYAVAAMVEDSAEGQALLAKCVQRYGGPDHLRQLRGARLRHLMTSTFGSEDVEVVRSFATGRRYRIMRPGEARLINGDRAWFQRADTLLVLDSGRYNAELYSYLSMRMPQALVFERSEDLRYGKRAGDPLGYFYMDKADTLMVVVGVDPADGLIKSTEGVIRQGEKSYVFTSLFSDHQEHQGYLVPGFLVNISMGLEVARSRLLDVEINPDFDEGEFLPSERPSGPEGL